MGSHPTIARANEAYARRMFDVTVVGSLNLDLVARMPRLPGPGETVSGISYDEFAGGKGLNQAVAAARSGTSVAMVGAVGGDHAGTDLRALVRGEGIDDARIATIEDAATGRAMIFVDGAAENSIVVIPGSNARVEVADLPPTRVVLAQLETTVPVVTRAFELAHAAAATTLLNPAPGAEPPAGLLANCDVVVPHEHELGLVGGVDALFAAGVGAVVVTRGAAGADLHRPGQHVLHVDAFPVAPVDTTGAGDAFCGALASRLSVGDELATAIRYATAAGALATTTPGAVPSQPTADAIRDLLGRA